MSNFKAKALKILQLICKNSTSINMLTKMRDSLTSNEIKYALNKIKKPMLSAKVR